MNKTILINRNLNRQEIDSISAEDNIYSNVPLDINQQSHSFKLPTNQIKSITDDYFTEVLDFGFKKFDNHTIVEMLSFDDRTFWYYFRLSLFFSGLDKRKEEALLQNFCKEHPNSTIEFHCVYKHFKDAFGNVKFIQAKKKKNLFFKIGMIVKYLILFLGRGIIGFVQNLKIRKSDSFVLLEPKNQYDIIDINNINQFVQGDYYNEYLSDYVLKQKNQYFISDYYLPKFSNPISLSKNFFFNKYTSRSLYFEYYILIGLFSLKRLLKLNALRKKINKLDSINTKNDIFETLKSKKKTILYMYHRELCAQKLFKKKSTKVIMAHHEQNYAFLSIFRGATLNKTKTIGFQHGVIHRLHPHYVLSQRDAIYHPIPDKFIVWGSHWKDFLVKNSIYKSEDVIALGQIRTDIIKKLNESKDYSKKFTVMFAAQGDKIGHKIKEKLTLDILQLGKDYENIEIVIKPHPLDSNAKEYIDSKAKMIGATNYLVYHGDLYLMLNRANIVVTFHSTVGSEALYFRKPLIVLNYQDNDNSNYLDYKGATFEAKNYSDLKDLVEKEISSKLHIDKEIQTKFIEKFCNEIDGNVSEKYFNFMQKYSSKNE